MVAARACQPRRPSLSRETASSCYPGIVATERVLRRVSSNCMKLAQQAKVEGENMRRKGRVLGASSGEDARSEWEIIYMESRGLTTFAAGFILSRAEVSWGHCQDALGCQREIWKSFPHARVLHRRQQAIHHRVNTSQSTLTASYASARCVHGPKCSWLRC
jgi:hypothetical protein